MSSRASEGPRSSAGSRGAAALHDAAACAVSLAAALLRRVWGDERLFLAALTLFNLFLARRTFEPGIWADNDSVCHYAYVRHLLEDVLPATGTYLGWTPKYNLGTPFLLFNTPPGLYLAAAAVARVTGLGALAGLKAVVLAAFLAVPLVGARLARTMEDEPGHLPKFVALALSLFTSELFGLEFFFKNGMLNPACALPLLLSALLFFRRAQRQRGPRALLWVALAAVAFGATVFVHLLSAYMLGLALAAFTLAEGPRAVGRSVVQVAAIGALGAGLAAFWLVPSLRFAAPEDAAYTWIRSPGETLDRLEGGNLFSSYPVGFTERFVQESGTGIVALVFAAFGLWRAIRLRRWPVLACFVAAAVALGIILGPRHSFGLWILPAYDRLLWYRFCTLFELMVLLGAGWGAWQLWQVRGRFGSVVPWGLALAALWPAQVMTKRAMHCETVASYPGTVGDVDRISAWLRAHAARGGRVFSEFLGQAARGAASVNYPRHMIPIESGVPEAGGWVYENNPAAQALLKRGLLWQNALPIVALAPRYDVQYVVAGSASLVYALAHDPRWRLALGGDQLSLFEAVGREPRMVEDASADVTAWRGEVTSERYLTGGGYAYVIDVAPLDPNAAPGGEILVKTSWSPAWRATIPGHELAIGATPEGLLRVALPPGTGATTITLTWGIDALRARGDGIALGALAVLGVLVLLSTRRKLPSPSDEALQWGGCAAAAAGAVVLAVRARPVDTAVVGFGVRGGMDVTYDTNDLRVGAFDDAEPARAAHVDPAAWGPGTLLEGEPARALRTTGAAAASIALSPVGPNRVVVRGATDDRRVTFVLRDPASGADVCEVAATLGEPAELPDACVAGGAIDGPGVRRDVVLHAAGPLVVSAITVASDVVVVEGEELHNALDDGGYDALYTYGPASHPASNGVTMKPVRVLEGPVALDRRINLPHDAYEAWVLTATSSEHVLPRPSLLLVQSDGRAVGDVEPRPRAPIDFWDEQSHATWVRVGRLAGGGTHLARVSMHGAGTMGSVDALAFVPVP